MNKQTINEGFVKLIDEIQVISQTWSSLCETSLLEYEDAVVDIHRHLAHEERRGGLWGGLSTGETETHGSGRREVLRARGQEWAKSGGRRGGAAHNRGGDARADESTSSCHCLLLLLISESQDELRF